MREKPGHIFSGVLCPEFGGRVIEPLEGAFLADGQYLFEQVLVAEFEPDETNK
jgi:hypothetical protein